MTRGVFVWLMLSTCVTAAEPAALLRTLPTGRAIDFGDKPEEQQRLCNLHLSPARRMGVELNTFGDSVGVLPGFES